MNKPIPRRTRASEPNTIAGTEDISILTLSEIRGRLERNARVLNTALFSTSPTSPAAPIHSPSPGPSSGLGTSPTSPFLRTHRAYANGANGYSPSPSTPTGNGSGSGFGSGDPLRDKLLAARQALLDRERELMMEEGMVKMEVGEPTSPVAESSFANGRRRSSGMGAVTGQGMMNGMNGMGGLSGKQRAMEAIQAGEAGGNTGRILPIAQTLAYAEREFDTATAQRMASMSILPPGAGTRAPIKRNTNMGGSTSHPKSAFAQSQRQGQGQGQGQARAYDPTDEIARAQANARVAAFMGYGRGRGHANPPGEDEDDDDDDDDGFFDDDWDGDGQDGQMADGQEGQEGEYDGEGDRFALGPQGREPYVLERGTGEEVDEMGEDDEGFKEGNDEYLDRVRPR